MQFWSAGSAAAGPHSSPSAAGNSSNPTSAYGTLRQARRAACPAAAGRVDGRNCRGPAMRRGPALILTCFRGRVLARHITCRAEQLVVGCAGPADASAGGGLKSAMAALTAFMSCGERAAAAYARCSPSRGAGLARRPIASGGRVFPVCFGREHIFGDFGPHTKLQWFAIS